MKRILIIAFHFPPDAAVGGVRPAKFAKYLPEFGWEPYVLTVDQSAYERIDTSRMNASLSGMIIRRVQLVPSPLELLERIRYAGKSLTLFASNPLLERVEPIMTNPQLDLTTGHFFRRSEGGLA
ncbi:MAG: glycosyltransferase family 4 protein [Deltaproteobacteria bacterium]|nr:glycosyltransferase family 4 protein [Deltaproteobacteria bacterium]